MPPKTFDPFLTAPGAYFHKLHKVDYPVQNLIGNGMFDIAGSLLPLIFLLQKDLDEKILQGLWPADDIFS